MFFKETVARAQARDVFERSRVSRTMVKAILPESLVNRIYP